MTIIWLSVLCFYGVTTVGVLLLLILSINVSLDTNQKFIVITYFIVFRYYLIKKCFIYMVSNVLMKVCINLNNSIGYGNGL